jgi:hypothetical protein
MRFADDEHWRIIRKAFVKSKMSSMNSWMVQATLAEARRQLEGRDV